MHKARADEKKNDICVIKMMSDCWLPLCSRRDFTIVPESNIFLGSQGSKMLIQKIEKSFILMGIPTKYRDRGHFGLHENAIPFSCYSVQSQAEKGRDRNLLDLASHIDRKAFAERSFPTWFCTRDLRTYNGHDSNSHAYVREIPLDLPAAKLVLRLPPM